MSGLHYFVQPKAGNTEWIAVEFDQLSTYIEAHGPELITTTATNAKTKGNDDETVYQAEFVAFDIDDTDISESIAAARRLVSELIAAGANPEQFQIFASGKKGFHVVLPMGLLTLKNEAQAWLVKATKLFAESRFVDGMDMAIYSGGMGRMLRQANVQRAIGTYKVQISLKELEAMNAEIYAKVVSQPRLLIAPVNVELVNTLALQWCKACDEAKALNVSCKQKAAKRVKDMARRESMPESIARTRLRDAVMYLAREQCEEYADYGAWFGMLAALHQVDEYALALEFSKAVPNWGGQRAFDDQWNKVSDARDDLLTEASIFQWAKGAAWKDEASKTKATEEVQGWLERIKADKGLAGDDGFIAWLRFLQRHDKAEYIRTMESPLLKGVKRVVSAALGELDGKDQPSHLDIALESLEELGGKSSLLFSSGCFYRYTGKAWQAIEEIQTVQAAAHKAFGGRNFTSSSVYSVVDLLKTEAHRPNVNFDQRSATVIAFENGELHLADSGSWSLKPHEAEHYITSLVPWAYDPNAKAERFLEWCCQVFQDDVDKAEKIQLLLEYIGYSLTASTHFQKFVILFGTTSNNGKSTLLDLMGRILGVQNVAHVKISDLGERFKVALLRGKLANLCAEISAGERIPDGALKSIVSGDSLTAEFKGRDGFNFRPYATLWFGANHKPSTRDFSPAIIDKRAEFLTFNRRFEAGKDEDTAIVDKLTPEIPGVIRISLEAYAKAVQRGYLTSPPSSKAVKAEWKAETDTVGEWFADCCYIDGDGVVAVSRALEEFKVWGAGLGYSVREYSSKAITSRLKPLGITCARVYIDGVQQRAYVGMSIEHSSTTPKGKTTPRSKTNAR